MPHFHPNSHCMIAANIYDIIALMSGAKFVCYPIMKKRITVNGIFNQVPMMHNNCLWNESLVSYGWSIEAQTPDHIVQDAKYELNWRGLLFTQYQCDELILDTQDISDGTVHDDCPRTSNEHQPFRTQKNTETHTAHTIVSWFVNLIVWLTAEGQKCGHRAENGKKNLNTHPISTPARFQMNWMKTFSVNVWNLRFDPSLVHHGAKYLAMGLKIESFLNTNKHTC